MNDVERRIWLLRIEVTTNPECDKIGTECLKMANFTSFVDYDNEKTKVAAVNNLSLQTAPSSSQSRYLDSPVGLLPNEIESGSFDNVSFSMQFGESELGRIFCTKVRLRFCPFVEKIRDLPRRSKYFDDFYDIPICGIARIMVLPVKKMTKSSKGIPEFDRMDRNYSSMDVISMIRLVLKDMRVVTIDLRKSQNGTHLANQIWFFSKCGPIEKMTQVGAALKEKGKDERKPFNNFDSWPSELKRCSRKTDSSAPWRVCALHKEGFSNSAQGYPMYVVVPAFWDRTDIDRLMQNWKLGRLPVWVWSRSNGDASLIISSNSENNVAKEELMGKVMEGISRAIKDEGATRNNMEGDRPFSMHLDKNFVTEIGKSYEKLIDLFAIDSYEQFVEHEHHYYAKLHDTKWLELIRSCMKSTFEAVRWICDRNRSIILFEDEGRDLSLIVASLTQICCDPFYRTTTGFQQLVEKMWIAFGHPFGQRLLGRDVETTKDRHDVHPTWLMFLDCCSQLIRIYPLEFTFSSHLLIALWDLSTTGIVAALTCNSLDDQLAYRVGGGPFPLEIYYEKEYTKMFGNIWHDAAIFAEAAKTHQPFSLNSKFLQCEVIRPPTSFGDILAWDDCYSRWILPANLRNGGVLLEMQSLDRKMYNISQKLPNIDWKIHCDLPEVFSSAYPYSMPEITSPVLMEINDSSIGEDYEMISRPYDLQEDNLSMMSSFTGLNFTQTPVLLTPNDKYDGLESLDVHPRTPSINMHPKHQVVSYSKYELDDYPSTSTAKVPSRNAETPILVTEQAPTPARRTTKGDRPIPPPRPIGLANKSTISTVGKEVSNVYVTEVEDNGRQVTRF